MTSVRVIAIEPINGRAPGDDFETSEREAKKLVERRLVRLAIDGAPNNKMRVPLKNKGTSGDPSGDDGQGQPSSQSPVAPVSDPKTSSSSESGGMPGRTGSTKAPRKATPAKRTPVRRSGA
jgi:hypothetical protein